MEPLDALRLLTSLDAGRRGSGAALPRLEVDWARLADLAAAHGVAPLAAHNLEHRPGAGAPEDVHDALRCQYHGTLADNVSKLVSLQHLLRAAPPVEVVLLHGAAYADALYPHVALRALPELRLLLRREDFPALARAGEPLGLELSGEDGGAAVLTDQRLRFLLHDALYGSARGRAEEEIFERGLPARAFGPRVRRPAIEDALLSHVALLASHAFAAPLVDYVDLRELARGAPNQAGPWERPPDAAALKGRARALGLQRALWCALQLVAGFFPEAAAEALALSVELPAPARALLQAAVVLPSLRLDRRGASWAAGQIRRLLV